jgi:hypothetical protein
LTACALIAPPSTPAPIRDGATLDELVAALWEALRADRAVACPMCGAQMSPEYGVHARAVGGSCSGCGAHLR